MTDVSTRVCNLFRKRVHPARLHLLSEDATFDELGLGTVDAWGFAFDWEEETGAPIDWPAIENAKSISDIISMVERRVGVSA